MSAVVANGFSDRALDYLRAHAIDPTLATEAGVTERDGALVYPYCGGRRRPLDGSRTFQPAGVPLALWWLRGHPNGSRAALVTEGEPDGLSASSALRDAAVPAEARGMPVVAIPGCGYPVGKLADELRDRGVQQVYLALDADEAGRNYAERAVPALREAGISPFVIRPADGRDLSDELVAAEHPGEHLFSLMLDAETEAAAKTPSTNGAAPADKGEDGLSAALIEMAVVSLDEFIAVDEPGATALVGDGDSVLIPENGDVMLYGDGGAGKTTLAIDLAFHVAAGEDWLDIPVARPAHVLLIENEGPRPLLRRKLRRKSEGWSGASLADRVSVFECPWAQFTFATPAWRAGLARIVKTSEVDVLIVGPLTRIGMDAAGTLQEVAAFMRYVQDVRSQSGRPLSVVLIHHENKGGTVSGAWEGSGDTLLHVQAAGNGHTVVFVQKARWASDRHQQSLKLAWTEGEGFAIEADDRNLLAEVVQLLSGDVRRRTAKEIAAPKTENPPGVGANEAAIRKLLEAHPERFDSCTGDGAKAHGRHPSSVLWQVSRDADSPESPCEFQGAAEGGESGESAFKDSPDSDAAPAQLLIGESAPSTHPTQAAE